MYATRPLSAFQSHPETASRPPPDGRNSGYLVVKAPDDDGEDGETCCLGTCGGTRVWDLPFPQNRVLTVRYTEHHGQSSTTYAHAYVFVPVPDQPLASNRYYAVVAPGSSRRAGLVRACSREEDMTPCCFCRCVNDVDPTPFDPADVYQQVEIVQRRRGRFTARAVAPDGFPYFLFRKKYWRVYASRPKSFDLGEARGLDAALRSRQLSDAGSVLVGAFTAASSTTDVGRWYCPFYLVKEDGVALAAQMERSAFYEVVLEQRWEPVHALGGEGSKLASRKALVGGSVEARQEAASSRHGDAYVWFRAAATGQRVGLCTSVWERMRWEEYRGGWVDEEEDAEKVAGAGGSVLVERFLLKRMDGSVAVAFDFVHLKKIRAKQT